MKIDSFFFQAYIYAFRSFLNKFNLFQLLFRYEIMTNCWHADPKERPTFEDIVKLTERMLLEDSVSHNYRACARMSV